MNPVEPLSQAQLQTQAPLLASFSKPLQLFQLWFSYLKNRCQSPLGLPWRLNRTESAAQQTVPGLSPFLAPISPETGKDPETCHFRLGKSFWIFPPLEDRTAGSNQAPVCGRGTQVGPHSSSPAQRPVSGTVGGEKCLLWSQQLHPEFFLNLNTTPNLTLMSSSVCGLHLNKVWVFSTPLWSGQWKLSYSTGSYGLESIWRVQGGNDYFVWYETPQI